MNPYFKPGNEKDKLNSHLVVSYIIFAKVVFYFSKFKIVIRNYWWTNHIAGAFLLFEL